MLAKGFHAVEGFYNGLERRKPPEAVGEEPEPWSFVGVFSPLPWALWLLAPCCRPSRRSSHSTSTGGTSGLALALRKVGVSLSCNVTAHPDDEHNGVLVRLSPRLGLRRALHRDIGVRAVQNRRSARSSSRRWECCAAAKS